MKNYKKKVSVFIIATIVILGIAAIVWGATSSPVDWLRIVIGCITFLLVMLYRKIDAIEDLEDKESTHKEYINTLKSKADRVLVDLDKVIIQEKNHYYTKTVLGEEITTFDFIPVYEESDQETVKRIYCDVKFKVKHHNSTRTLKTSIAKDETSLRIHFYLQKQTYAYINAYDKDEYYIDLDFLKEESPQ